MLPSFCRDTITILTPVAYDDHGTQHWDYDDPACATRDIDGCSVQPGATVEDQVHRVDGETIRFTVYLPETNNVLSHEAVIWQGERYSVNGTPQDWRSPTGAVDNDAMYLVAFRG